MIFLTVSSVATLAGFLFVHARTVKGFEEQRRMFAQERRDLLDRLMFAQGNKWVNPPRLPDREEDEEPALDLEWRDL